MHVWILQTGEPMPLPGSVGRPMRSMNLANALIERGHSVVLWTADWHHTGKEHFFGRHTKVDIQPGYELRLIHSHGYRRNVGLARLADHAELGWQLHHLLDREDEVPDVAVLGLPPIEPAYVMAKWLSRRGVPTLLDVKDQWPDVLLRAVPSHLQRPGRAILWPYFRMAKSTMREATGLSSMTKPFLQWCLDNAGRAAGPADGVFPLTAPRIVLSREDEAEAKAWWADRGIVFDGRPRISFVGTMNAAFDFGPVARAAMSSHFEFVICGSGSRQDEVHALLSKEPSVHLPGWVSHKQAEVLAQNSQIALGPYIPTPDFRNNIPNKVYDAMAHAQPFISSLTGAIESEVYARNAGRAYSIDSGPDDLCNLLAQFELAPNLLSEMSASALELYETRFSYEAVYGGLVAHLVAMASAH